MYPPALQQAGKRHLVLRYSAEISLKVNERELADFPFDQVEATILLRPGEDLVPHWNVSLDESIIRPLPPKPVKFFLAHEMNLVTVACRMSEHNGIKYAVRMNRQWGWYMQKIVVPTAGLQIASWAATCQLSPEEFADQLNLLLTVLITQAAMLYVVSDSIPKVGYLTTLDRFLVVSNEFLFFQVGYTWLKAMLSFYMDPDRLRIGSFVFDLMLPICYTAMNVRIWWGPYSRLRKPMDHAKGVDDGTS
eukprot:6874954-Prymnesium_polylepis.1